MPEEPFNETGIVVTVKNGTAHVRIFEENVSRERCVTCGSCGGGGQDRLLEVDAGTIEAGEMVLIEIHPPPMLRGVIVLFLVPIILFVIGAAAGEYGVPAIWATLEGSSTLFAVAGAIALAGFWYGFVMLVGGKLAGKDIPPNRIVRTIERGERTAKPSPGCAVFRVAQGFALDAKTEEEIKKVSGIISITADGTIGRLSIAHDRKVISDTNIRELLFSLGVRLED